MRTGHVIFTERLVIEPAVLEDKSEEFAQAIHEANEFEWYFGVEETEEYLEELSICREKFYNIFDSNGEFLGYVGFHKECGNYEIEIYILKQFRRNGYAREAMVAIMKEAFEGKVAGTTKEDFSKIVSSVRSENEASIQLMEKCGFEKDKDLGMCLLFYASLDDEELSNPIHLVHYTITRESFLSREEAR